MTSAQRAPTDFELPILERLERNEIPWKAGVSRRHTSRSVTTMTKLGWVEWSEDGAANRPTYYRLTEDGRRILAISKADAAERIRRAV